MELINSVADLNHLCQVFSHYQQKHASRNGRLKYRVGSDGERLTDFAARLHSNLRTISEALLRGEYVFSPFVENKITIAGGTSKVISIATLRDNLVQKATALVVEPELDAYLADNCYSFRHGEEAPGINDAISAVVRHHSEGRYWVVKEDISAYFDNLEHELLLTQLQDFLPFEPAIMRVYESYLKAPRLVGGELLLREKGVPVGSVLANFLSNLYLTPLDRLMEQEGHRYLRYCDDVIVFCDSESQAQQVQAMIAQVTTEFGLSLNPRKSLLVRPGGRFTHLGYEFDGPSIRIGPRALHKFRAKIKGRTSRKRWKGLTHGNLHTEQGKAMLRELIAQVNEEISSPTMRNWARYFAKCDFDDQFRELDHWIRDRVRGAATKRWNKGNYRLLPTSVLQELGLKSLVGEYYKWRNRWQDKDKRLINSIASLDHLREILKAYRERYYNPRRMAYDFKPGADGVTMGQFIASETSELKKMQAQLLKGEYRFAPFVEYSRAKQGRSDERVICRAALADTVVQKAIAEVVDRRFDHVLSDRCHSYRRGKSQFSAFGQALKYIRMREDWWILRYDFRSFLDTVDLSILSSQLHELLSDEPLVLDLYLKYLYNARLRDGKLLPRLVGLPRGGILTPFLANLYLTPLDEAMVREGFHYIRYADDVIVFAEDEARAKECQRVMDRYATELRLIFSPEKSLLIQPGQEFEYLGYLIQGQEVRVRPYAINSLKRRIRRITAKRKYPHLTSKTLATREGEAKLGMIISRVNRTYTYKGGSDWTRHFCRCTTDEQFRELDGWIADRIRACVTKRWAVKNRCLIPHALLRELGWKPLVPMFYRWRREVWNQGNVSE
jgi:RNA-directed DNA polymerase